MRIEAKPVHVSGVGVRREGIGGQGCQFFRTIFIQRTEAMKNVIFLQDG